MRSDMNRRVSQLNMAQCPRNYGRPIYAARRLLCLLTGILAISVVTQPTSARNVNVIDPVIMPVVNTSDDVRDELLAHWEAFPLVDNTKHVDPDDGDMVITQDGRTCTDEWQRLMINDKPVIIKGERYSGFRFVTKMPNGRDFYFGVRKLKSDAQWNIVFKDEPIPGFEKTYKHRTQPRYHQDFYANYLNGKHLKDDKEYLIYFKLKSKLPEELAFRYKFINPKSLSPLPISAGRMITYMILHRVPEVAEPKARLSTGIVLIPKDIDEHKKNVIGRLVPDGFAEKAGLKPGDTLLELDYHRGNYIDNEVLRETELNYDRDAYNKAKKAAKPGQYISESQPREINIAVQREGQPEPMKFKVMTTEIEIATLRAFKKALRDEEFERVGGPADEMYAEAMKLLAQPANATNRTEAFVLLQKSSRKMYYPAMTQLAILYNTGEGVEKNHEKSLEILTFLDTRRRGPTDKEIICYLLAEHYTNGWGTPVDNEKALYHYRHCDNYVPGIMKLAELTLSAKLPSPDGSNPDSAMRIFMKANQQGEPEGAFRAGQVAAGIRDQNRQFIAVRFYLAAAEKNHSGAMVELGKYHEFGLGNLKQDYAQAINWYQKAWDLKNPQAAQRLGLLYDAGKGVERNPAKAQELLTLAKEQGVVDITNPYIFPARPVRKISTRSRSTPASRR